MKKEPLFAVTDVDRRFYEDRLRAFLPERMIDVHTHVWLARFRAAQAAEPLRAVTWPGRVARDNSIEDLIETYRLMFPGKAVTPLIFGNVLSRADDVEGGNAYVSGCAAKHACPALLFALPHWSAAEFERRVTGGGFIGAKVYLTLSEAYLPEKEIRIYDFLPRHQLEVLDRHGWIVMLHVPRDGRIRDAVNLAQLREIDQLYPHARVIIAHAGRAYCPEDVGNAYEVLARTEHLMFDISANTSRENFTALIRAVGPARILFGSDMPILRMRTQRVCESGNYINLVPRGMYGDLSGDRHMREVDGAEAEGLTFFMYEEIDAFRQAAEASGLTRDDVEDIFCNNAARLIRAAGAEG